IVASSPFDETARAGLLSLGSEVMELVDAGAKAVSMIVDPTGKLISSVLRDEEGFAIADIDMNILTAHKRLHDVVGHYNRFDVFNLSVNMNRLKPFHPSSDSLTGEFLLPPICDENEAQ